MTDGNRTLNALKTSFNYLINRKSMKRLHTSMKCIVGILLVVLMVVPNGLKAETTEVFQASKVTGVVLDELGEPVIGVTVRVKNDKRNGTITNADGRYVISVSKMRH